MSTQKAAMAAGQTAHWLAQLDIIVPRGGKNVARKARVQTRLQRPAGVLKKDFPRERDTATAVRRLNRGLQPDVLAAILSAMGHPTRLVILATLLEGPANHQLLTVRTGLKAGPLYHHLSALREAGLIGPKSRDVYTLTEKGTHAYLAALALGKIVC